MTIKTFNNSTEVFTALSQHLDFVPFMNVFTVSPSNRESIITAKYGIEYRLQVLNRLSNYNNYNLIVKKIEFKRKTPDLSFLSGYQRRLYHSLLYVERKIHKLQLKKQRESIKLLSEIIDFLLALPKKLSEIAVKVNEDALIEFIEEDPMDVKSLQSFYDLRLKLLSPLMCSIPTPLEVKDELKRMIEIMSLTVDSNTSFFPQHPLQPTFDRVLSSPLLPYGKSINSIIDDFQNTDPAFYVQEIFDEVVGMLNDLQFNELRHDMALVLLLYRYIFDRCYPQNELIRKNCEFDIIAKLRNNVTLDDIGAPAEYCPPHTKNQSVEEIFRKDPHFSKAVSALESVVFYVNPFDILNCVENCVTKIEQAATIYGGCAMIFPFEVTFGLFMCCLISSQISNWENIVDFVLKYTPATGLAPRFEFARAKIEASVVEAHNMYPYTC